MKDKFENLSSLLRELFQLDQPDLDFGIYRVMHLKRDEIINFLDNKLLSQTEDALNQYRSFDRSRIYEDLQAAIEDASVHFDNPEDSKAVKALRAKLNSNDADVSDIVSDVFDHLYRFFNRYYVKGDFLARRVFKKGVYAIPYEGEEVSLYWANKDHYYIKTSEYFQNYTFRLNPNNEENPMRVNFCLADLTDETNRNVEALGETNRVFVLAEEEGSNNCRINEIDGECGKELVIYFEYRPPHISDWPADHQDKNSPPKQTDLLKHSSSRILNQLGNTLQNWYTELAKLNGLQSGSKNNGSILDTHLKRYAARNTFDYFIHKDLKGFLIRELDFYIKNEIMHLDDIENSEDLYVELFLSKIKVIRSIAHKIIDFLTQIEEFQLKLWKKKKFVVTEDYCFPLKDLPEGLRADVAATPAIVKSWKQLKLNGTDRTLYPVDTGLLTEPLRDLVISTIDHDMITGTLIIGDNRSALSLLLSQLKDQVRMVYMDPPFNTGSDGFAYKDRYKHSSWLSMMRDRIELIVPMLKSDGTLYAHIDYNEKERLKLLLDLYLVYVTEIIWRIGWISGFKSKADKFIRNHDTILQFSKGDKPFFKKTYIPYPEGYTRRDGDLPEGEGQPLEDTWNCSELDELNSIQIISFSKEKVGDKTLTQKNESLLKRMMLSSSEEGDLVVDPFLGSGTTAAVAMKLKRRWMCCEIMDHVFDITLPRLKRVLAGDQRGISADKDVQWAGGSGFRYTTIESYEDTLNNLTVKRAGNQDQANNPPEEPIQRNFFETDEFKEKYLINYMLDVETRESPSLFNLRFLSDPTAYKLKIKRTGSDECRHVTVDLIASFNYLLGLKIRNIAAPQSFDAEFERDKEKRLRLKGSLIPSQNGGGGTGLSQSPVHYRMVGTH